MTRVFTRLSLEDSEDPSWERALVRLAVAFEIFEGTDMHGFWIIIDEKPEAFADIISYLAYIDGYGPEETVAAAKFFQMNAKFVRSWNEACSAIYPYFHEGEEMPK